MWWLIKLFVSKIKLFDAVENNNLESAMCNISFVIYSWNMYNEVFFYFLIYCNRMNAIAYYYIWAHQQLISNNCLSHHQHHSHQKQNVWPNFNHVVYDKYIHDVPLAIALQNTLHTSIFSMLYVCITCVCDKNNWNCLDKMQIFVGVQPFSIWITIRMKKWKTQKTIINCLHASKQNYKSKKKSI